VSLGQRVAAMWRRPRYIHDVRRRAEGDGRNAMEGRRRGPNSEAAFQKRPPRHWKSAASETPKCRQQMWRIQEREKQSCLRRGEQQCQRAEAPALHEPCDLEKQPRCCCSCSLTCLAWSRGSVCSGDAIGSICHSSADGREESSASEEFVIWRRQYARICASLSEC
jgi:hypothetical protein